jgi:transposase
MIVKCACCGAEMTSIKDIGSSIIYKCPECGLSDSRLKEGAKETKS